MSNAEGAPGRLLVSLPESSDLRSALEQNLPSTSWVFAAPTDTGPWEGVDAWLVGSVVRELPHWTAAQTPRLRFVQRLFTGMDDFPFDRFPPGVSIAGNVGAYAPFVAEHAVALLLAVSHNVLANAAQVREGRLRPPRANDYLSGKTVLLLGYGAIGRSIAERLRPFGVRLEGLSRLGGRSEGLSRLHSAEHLAEALGGADVVIDCRPLTSATRRSLDAATLDRFRPGAIYVNVGRAGVVDEGALYDQLLRHPGFRAAIDVWWAEDFESGRLTLSHPFPDLPNFLGSPHVAGVGAAARRRAIDLAVENLGRFFRGEVPHHLADRAEYR